MKRIGIDIGSTTVKMAVIDENGKMLFSAYERHNAQARSKLVAYLRQLMEKVGDAGVTACVTGSVGMGLAEKAALPFVQEVVAASRAVQSHYPAVRSMIDIGGEDAKVVFFRDGKAADLRMNGNCAGGTGAFIDQMAILLGTDATKLGWLAAEAKEIHPIASRCGVFSKTDIQNLIARGVSREDIAASVFHAVAVQCVVTLARGCDIEPPILLCGGPLTFIPALREAFADYLKLSLTSDFILPVESHLIPALGAALSSDEGQAQSLSELISTVENDYPADAVRPGALPPIFESEEEHLAWRKKIEGNALKERPLQAGQQTVSIGIDSGSTTTKVVVLDENSHLVFRYYANNNGDPIGAARRGLQLFQEEAAEAGAEIVVKGSRSTGYGEDLLKASFGMDGGIIETIAHYMAARHLTQEVSFILDIGGQDMKAIFVNGGVIDRIEINEACSSGCGSFIETFAKSLGYGVEDFARLACTARAPYDLGTRCTVFMNSKVKQALREGATVGDIAAGLSYSVVKNCLYKVLRLKSTTELGGHIVMQGGTMKNDGVVRTFEQITGKRVFRSSRPELMGAVGCALYAQQAESRTTSLEEMLASATYTTRQQQCRGCENHCQITVYNFAGGRRYYSGNRCENVFTNKGKAVKKGRNAYSYKLHLLFDRPCEVEIPLGTVGLPRALGMYEEYPFWHALFMACGIQPVLSDTSTMGRYEKMARQVMSDNICFPAKLVHCHIQNLVEKNVSRIFMPYVVYERNDGGQNSFNCPIVTAYSEVVKGSGHGKVPLDTPAITFKDGKLLFKQCADYLEQTWGISRRTVGRAFDKAVVAYNEYVKEIVEYNKALESRTGAEEAEKSLTVLLAGRPYHSDPLVQHKLSDLLAAQGVDVITDDIVRGMDVADGEVNFFSQWAYPHRILKAATWTARQGREVQFMQMTSFGCGPDAFLTDEVRDLLKRHGKALALLKIDDVSNMGSVKLRVRSLIESLKLSENLKETKNINDLKVFKYPKESPAIFEKKDRRRKIIAPFFTPFISPLLPSLVGLAGYDLECLPVSDFRSCELGLRHANNEVCYPATLIVGDIVKAFEGGKYDPKETAVIMTQTGGQCRATNYLSLIKKALKEAGFGEVPVISLAPGSGIDNEQPGFSVNWRKIIGMTIATLLYSDALAKCYYAALPREREKGQADALLNRYLNEAKGFIARNDKDGLWECLGRAAADFDAIVVEKECRRVGIVGEIFLKFNPFAQQNITGWLTEQGFEVVPPMLTDFFLQTFVNVKVNQDVRLERKRVPDFLLRLIYNKVWKQTERANTLCRHFRYFTPFESIWTKAEEAEKVVSLCAQFGEGWLLPGEVLSMARGGVNHVVSLQPFGCIANHIVAKGLEKRLKNLFPDLNFLTLDFDSSVSETNVRNRMLLFTQAS